MRRSTRTAIALLLGAGLTVVQTPSVYCQDKGQSAVRSLNLQDQSLGSTEERRSWFALPKMPKLPKMPWSREKGSSSGKANTWDAVNFASPSHQTIEGQVAVARLAERRGQTDQAETVYRALLEKDPSLSLVNHRLGILEAKHGNFAAADSHLQAALAAEPENVDLLVDAGYCCYLQNRYGEAEDLYKRAFQLAPDKKSLCNNLGLLLGETARYDEALSLFKRTAPEAEAHANLAFIMTQAGEIELARKHYLLAISLDPTLRKAAHALVQLSEHDRSRAIAASMEQPSPNSPQEAPPTDQLQNETGIEVVQTRSPVENAPQVIPASQHAATIPVEQRALVESRETVPAYRSAKEPQVLATQVQPSPVYQTSTPTSNSHMAHIATQVQPSPVYQTEFQAPAGNQNAKPAPVIVPAGHREAMSSRRDYAGDARSQPAPSQMRGTTQNLNSGSQQAATDNSQAPIVVGDLPASSVQQTPGNQPRESSPKSLPSLPTSLPLSQNPTPYGLHYNLNPHSQVRAVPAVDGNRHSSWQPGSIPGLPNAKLPQAAANNYLPPRR